MSDNKCARCGRRLKDPNATYGPICARKVAAEQARDQRNADDSIVITPTITDGYAGARGPDGAVKVVRIRNGVQEPLEGRWHHTGFSHGQFNWGYGGSGPADLARSIIADLIGTDNPDPAIYQPFKWEFVSSWGDRWEISLDEIRAWAEKRAAAQ
jgi:hypothetical protein